MTAIGAPAASSCAARICAAPEKMIGAQPERAEPGRARGRGADAAHQSERNEADARRQHLGEARAKIGRKRSGASRDRARVSRYFGGAGKVTYGGRGS